MPVFTGIYADPSVLARHKMEFDQATNIECDLEPNKVIGLG